MDEANRWFGSQQAPLKMLSYMFPEKKYCFVLQEELYLMMSQKLSQCNIQKPFLQWM